MKLDTILEGGQVVSAKKTIDADVGILDGKIAIVGKKLVKKYGAERVVDVSDRYVIPGGIDVHVHLALPFCGTTSADDYDSGTRAGACGGVTTLIDFAIPYGEESLQQALDNWMAKARGKACIDYSFHVAVTKWDKHQHELKSIMDQGIPTFKVFMIYQAQGWQTDDYAMFALLERLRELGGMMLVHAESSRVLDLLIDRHHNPEEMKKYGAYLHTMTRPNFIESEAIERVIRWTKETGGKTFVVHMSTKEGTDLIKQARKDGVDIVAETCAQYLVLDDSVFKKKDGHMYATCPQLKRPEDQKRLWKGLRDGDVVNVSTDTCTFTTEQKAMWEGDWTKIPMGMPGLETLLPIVYTHGVLKKQLTVNEFVDRCCTSPAKVMGLYPRKGVIEEGSDADVAVIHPKKTRKVDWKTMQTNCDWSPFQGWNLAGFAEHTFVRGQQVVEDYKFVGQNGYGQFIPRGPFKKTGGKNEKKRK